MGCRMEEVGIVDKCKAGENDCQGGGCRDKVEAKSTVAHDAQEHSADNCPSCWSCAITLPNSLEGAIIPSVVSFRLAECSCHKVPRRKECQHHFHHR
jgi:hypothetical protein